MRQLPDDECREIIMVISGHLKRYYGDDIKDIGLPHYDYIRTFGYEFLEDEDKRDSLLRIFKGFTDGNPNYALLIYESEFLSRPVSIARFAKNSI